MINQRMLILCMNVVVGQVPFLFSQSVSDPIPAPSDDPRHSGISSYIPDPRSGLPSLTQPEHFVKSWPAVSVQAKPQERYPDELEEKYFSSPDPYPVGLAWDGKSLWVSGIQTGRLYQLDSETGTVLTSIMTPGPEPAGLAFDGKVLWCIDAHSRTLTGIEDGRVVRQFVLDWACRGIAGGPNGLIISDADNPIFRVVSPESGNVIDTFVAPDTKISGMTKKGSALWCGRGATIIVHDLEHKRPVCGFSIAGRVPEDRQVTGLAFANGRLWSADRSKGRIASIPIPQHGQRISARGAERQAVFAMSVRNTSQHVWKAGSFLMNVPIYEMPGQRLIDYRITPEPVAHYRDPEGNLHALIAWQELAPTEGFQVVVRARLWSADRWTFVDPRQEIQEYSEPLKSICRDRQGKRYPLDDPAVREFIRKAVGDEPNPFWKFRLAHDAFVQFVTYTEPPDESVVGVLRTGKGVCRNFSDVLVTFGRNMDIPILDAWAPHHNLCCVWISGAGWVFVEPTANNTSGGKTQWSRTCWSSGLPRDQLTTGVAGPSLFGDLLVDGKPYVPGWHCRIPKELKGFRHAADWATRGVSDSGNGQPFFPALLRARLRDKQVFAEWFSAADPEDDAIEYRVEAKTEDGAYREIGRTKDQRFEFKPEGNVVAVRVTALDGRHGSDGPSEEIAIVRQ